MHRDLESAERDVSTPVGVKSVREILLKGGSHEAVEILAIEDADDAGRQALIEELVPKAAALGHVDPCVFFVIDLVL
jgi:hypothetical protein